MANPHERILITALIPHADNPELHLRDAEGNPPTEMHEHGTRTYEETFRLLGRRASGYPVSVDYRVASEGAASHGIVYQAKPLAFEPGPEHPFQWQPLPRGESADEPQ